MNPVTRCLAALTGAALLPTPSLSLRAAEPPAPFGAIPSARQLAWSRRQMYGFVHFTVNTFTDKEWGYGDESPEIFNPDQFSADQIVSAAKGGGLTGLILTCKHHDGFCLWPSAYTEHSIKHSPYQNGHGDIVREISDACRRQGLAFGIYLSPWDRNRADYGTPTYPTYYRNQLRELLTNYGPLFEVWFDGANGGDGYYGGARTKRTIDAKTYYGWEQTYQLVRELQPNAVMFSDVGPDARWVGNEKGSAGETCWATMNPGSIVFGNADQHLLNTGERLGQNWLPAEADVSIRPGWFYHASEDARVKTSVQLAAVYDQSIGRGANLILNLPPDRHGLIPASDQAALRGLKEHLDRTFAHNLLAGATLSPSNVRGGIPRFGAQQLVDGNLDSYWCTDDSMLTPDLTVRWARPQRFSVAVLREAIGLGQRIAKVRLERWSDEAGPGQWLPVAEATSIGSERILRFAPVTASRVRLRVIDAAACPAIAEFGLYLEPAN